MSGLDKAHRLLQLAQEDPVTFHTLLSVSEYIDYYEVDPGEALQSLHSVLCEYKDELAAIVILNSIRSQFGDQFIKLRDQADIDNDSELGKKHC